MLSGESETCEFHYRELSLQEENAALGVTWSGCLRSCVLISACADVTCR